MNGKHVTSNEFFDGLHDVLENNLNPILITLNKNDDIYKELRLSFVVYHEVNI